MNLDKLIPVVNNNTQSKTKLKYAMKRRFSICLSIYNILIIILIILLASIIPIITKKFWIDPWTKHRQMITNVSPTEINIQVQSLATNSSNSYKNVFYIPLGLSDLTSVYQKYNICLSLLSSTGNCNNLDYNIQYTGFMFNNTTTIDSSISVPGQFNWIEYIKKSQLPWSVDKYSNIITTFTNESYKCSECDPVFSIALSGVFDFIWIALCFILFLCLKH